MKKSLFVIALMFATSVFAAETQKVCFKDPKGKEVCKEVKIHKKLDDRYLTKHEDLLFYAGPGNTFNQVRDLPPDFQLKMHKGR